MLDAAPMSKMESREQSLGQIFEVESRGIVISRRFIFWLSVTLSSQRVGPKYPLIRVVGVTKHLLVK